MIADVNREIEFSDQQSRRLSEHARLTAIIRGIDLLMFSLEELNLRGIDRVPAHLRQRAGLLIEQVRTSPPPDEAHHDPFRIRYRVVPMMDVLFDVQDRVLRLRHPAQIPDLEDVPESA